MLVVTLWIHLSIPPGSMGRDRSLAGLQLVRHKHFGQHCLSYFVLRGKHYILLVFVIRVRRSL